MNALGVVYSITNKINHKIYIGQTTNFKRRVWEHKNYLVKGKHKNHYLQSDYNKYGLSNFEFKIEAKDLCRKDRLLKETELINYYGGIESINVYNFQDNINENEEMRKLVSENQKGKIIKPESIEKMRKKLIGRTLTEEHIQHIKQATRKFIGEANPAKRPEVRQKISKAVKGQNNGMYNKHHTLEAREKIRQSRLGKSPANKGKSLSIESRNNISKGVRLSKIKNGSVNLALLKQLKAEFEIEGTYKAVAELHPHIPYRKIRSMILKCNDYLEIE